MSKHTATLSDDTPLAERTNMVYKGTTVAAGTARVLVTATGAATEVGRIGSAGRRYRARSHAARASARRARPPARLARLGVAALVAALGALQGVPLGLVLETAIALAVAAVPEALPAVATIALAVGVRRMARRRALVRRLPAVESLGSTTVVCTDKTRTLTSGDMTVVRVWADGTRSRAVRRDRDPSLPRVRHALEVAALASRPQARTCSQWRPTRWAIRSMPRCLRAADRRHRSRSNSSRRSRAAGLSRSRASAS